jgi:hypothetical protein
MSYLPTDPNNQPSLSGMPSQGNAYPPSGAALMHARLPASSQAIWSMVLGIVAIVAGFLIDFMVLFIPDSPLHLYNAPAVFWSYTMVELIAVAVPLAISIVTIVLSHITLAQVRRGLAVGKRYAIAGLVLGYVNIALPVALLILDVTLFIVICSSTTC